MKHGVLERPLGLERAPSNELVELRESSVRFLAAVDSARVVSGGTGLFALAKTGADPSSQDVPLVHVVSEMLPIVITEWLEVLGWIAGPPTTAGYDWVEHGRLRITDVFVDFLLTTFGRAAEQSTIRLLSPAQSSPWAPWTGEAPAWARELTSSLTAALSADTPWTLPTFAGSPLDWSNGRRHVSPIVWTVGDERELHRWKATDADGTMLEAERLAVVGHERPLSPKWAATIGLWGAKQHREMILWAAGSESANLKSYRQATGLKTGRAASVRSQAQLVVDAGRFGTDGAPLLGVMPIELRWYLHQWHRVRAATGLDPLDVQGGQTPDGHGARTATVQRFMDACGLRLRLPPEIEARIRPDLAVTPMPS